jgi:ribosomal RNA-processing protein RRP42 (EC 3.1.13.-)
MPKDEAGVLSEIKRNYILKKLKEGKRGDGRSPESFREISITTNYVPRSAGSAYVKLGRTKVVAGIKIESGEPFPDTPNQGGSDHKCGTASHGVPHLRGWPSQ